MLPVSKAWSRPRQRFVALLIFALSLYILIPQAAIIRQSLKILGNLSIVSVVAAIICIAFTFPLAAGSYHFLARRRLLFRRTVIVALANMFTNRLLPAGAGSIATFFVYLRKRKHTVNQATSVVAINNFLGTLSHGSLLVVLFIFDRHGFNGFMMPAIKPIEIIIVVCLLIFLAVLATSRKKWRNRFIALGRSLGHELLFYKSFPLRLSGAYISSTLLTILNAMTLWFCVQAVHGHIGIIASLAVFTIGIIVGTVTPTPGGIGGTEAGLLAGLIGYHVHSQIAFAAVVLYRLITYWLTLVLGAAAYGYVEYRGYLHRFEPKP